MLQEDKGNLAWKLHNKISENETQRRILLLQNMQFIHQIHSDKLYKVLLGDEEAPWSAYLGQNEVYYSTSKVYTMDKVYGKFIVELGVDNQVLKEIPLSKLSNLIGVVTKENVEEWLTKARELTGQDFNDELRKATGKISYLECPHKNEVDYKICQSCGYRHKI